MDLELAGKTVLITGGTDGLGLALAVQLASEGAAVGVCGRDEERLHAAEGAVRSAGGDVLALRADVSRAGELQAFVEAAVARWGRIDGVVHNAGRASAGAIDTVDDATWESDFQLKLMAAVRLTRLALPQLRASRGAVLFTLALAAKAPGASSEPSSVTRAAGMALMKALSKELAPDGIRVNAVLIGLIESGQWVRVAAGSGTEPACVLRPLRSGRRHSTRPLRPRRRIRRPRLLPAVFARLVSDGHRDQPRRGSVAVRLRVSCSPPSRSCRPSRPARGPTAKPSIMSSRVRASTWARPSPPHLAFAARRADSMSSATTNTTSWSSPMRPAPSSPPRNAAKRCTRAA